MNPAQAPTKEEIQDARIAALEQYIASMDGDHSDKIRRLTKTVNALSSQTSGGAR